MKLWVDSVLIITLLINVYVTNAQFDFNEKVCMDNGTIRKSGEEWVIKNHFVMRCFVHIPSGNWRTEVVACLMPDGTKVPAGSSGTTDGSHIMLCKMNNGIASIEWQWNGQMANDLKVEENINQGCTGRNVGERWRERAFELECSSDGQPRLVACITKFGSRRIEVGTAGQNGSFTLTCKQLEDGSLIFNTTEH